MVHGDWIYNYIKPVISNNIVASTFVITNGFVPENLVQSHYPVEFYYPGPDRDPTVPIPLKERYNKIWIDDDERVCVCVNYVSNTSGQNCQVYKKAGDVLNCRLVGWVKKRLHDKARWLFNVRFTEDTCRVLAVGDRSDTDLLLFSNDVTRELNKMHKKACGKEYRTGIMTMRCSFYNYLVSQDVAPFIIAKITTLMNYDGPILKNDLVSLLGKPLPTTQLMRGKLPFPWEDVKRYLNL